MRESSWAPAWAAWPEQIHTEATFDYESLPHFPRSTSIGHAGQLVCGTLDGCRWWPWKAASTPTRATRYRQITFPVRVMRALGAELLIVSNACGGMNPQYAQGDIMVIEDHINLMNGNPLVGRQRRCPGPALSRHGRPYDPALIDAALEIARRENFVAHKGVYVA